jgi:hypothetical protein
MYARSIIHRWRNLCGTANIEFQCRAFLYVIQQSLAYRQRLLWTTSFFRRQLKFALHVACKCLIQESILAVTWPWHSLRRLVSRYALPILRCTKYNEYKPPSPSPEWSPIASFFCQLAMENIPQNQTEALHLRPSMELPSAKKPKHMMCEKRTTLKTTEIIQGNNRYGSKGTIRCRKCQQRKGKVFWLYPHGMTEV